ncbi:MAG TPA: DUF1059 domain-containing protein [Solirubrobacteraceae bacterium]|nr:DUF1059 domain-containing protein [Solirubrobacteraceae bacterium]
MGRVMADCRRFESDSGCTLTIIGEEDEVVRTAVEHSISVHGHQDSPELAEQVRAMLEPASAYTAEREAQPFPA